MKINKLIYPLEPRVMLDGAAAVDVIDNVDDILQIKKIQTTDSIKFVEQAKETSLPFIKLKAKEIFGHYDEEEQVFELLESPKFELSAYKKGAGLHDRNDQWDKFDLG